MKNLIELADLGKRMRKSQEEYSRTKSSIAEGECKKLVKEFDKAIEQIIGSPVEVSPENQLILL